MREDNKRRWQQSIGFIDACINTLQYNNVKILGRALIKKHGTSNDDAVVYGRSIMHICQHFNTFLEQHQDFGMVVADSRRVAQNKRTTHTIFTQRHQARGNSYPKIVEMPVYGHSNNFAMLQLVDIVCSAVIFPMLIDSFNVHLSDKYAVIRDRYKDKIKNMQFMHKNEDSHWVGGLLVADKTACPQKTSYIFR